MERANITEPTILLNLKQLYRPGMSGNQLYDTTRGVWKVSRERASRAAFAAAVVDGKILQIYTIQEWYPANTGPPYLSGRQDQSEPRYAKRFEFTGRDAPSEIKDKYLGLSVEHLMGGQNPVRYLNC
jgi:hypothetical protein